MTTLRVSVSAEPAALGWRFRFSCRANEGWSHSHEAPTYEQSPWLPRPAGPCGHLCAHDHRWCPGTEPAALEKALAELRHRSGDGVAVGRWLYDILLQPVRSEIDQLAARSSADVVELALTWPFPHPEQDGGTRRRWRELSSLPWELMRDDRGPLAVSGRDDQVAVTVTRVVAGAAWTVAALPAPPKVLFVLGAAMTDESVRAGAEVLGLLREVEAAGRRVNHRVLEQATPSTLRRAVAAFRPDVVHLICHGGTDAEGRGYLRLTADQAERDGDARHTAGEPTFDDWTADKLLEQLRAGGWQPSVVVLSACHTAGSLRNGRRATALGGAQLAAPFAVELIRNGIPVVVAMAGTIADRACRVFTRHFGRALAGGQSLVAATAQARRMAFAELPAADGIDWALPAVFLAEGVDPDIVRAADDPAAASAQLWSNALALDPLPLFCARERILAAFWSLLPCTADPGEGQAAGSRPATLVLSTPNEHSWVGKTRMLQELARQALTNGCLPLLLYDEAPRDVVGFARLLANALDWLVTEEVLPDAEPSELRWLANALAYGPSDEARHRAVADELRRGPWAGLRQALCLDASIVLAAARRAHPALLRPDARLIVLVDNLGEQSMPLLSAMFARTGVGEHGLGRRTQPVPLVAVMLGTGDDIRRQVRDRTVPAARWIEVAKLSPFSQTGDEDLLAYESVLLYPFRGADGDHARQPWVFNRELDHPMWQRSTQFLRNEFKGLPGMFGKHDSFELILRAIELPGLIVPANDGGREIRR